MRLPANDVQRIVERTAEYWPSLRGKRLFVTGGTGFFGRWLLESFVRANAELDLQAECVVLTRDVNAFLDSAPHLRGQKALDWLQGDVRQLLIPSAQFDFVLHGAMTTAAETFHKLQSPLQKYDLVVEGSRRVFELAAQCGVSKLLLLSSGPTYGRQPAEMAGLSEDYPGAPLTTDCQFDFSMLGEAKRVAELMANVYAQQQGFEVAIARCFSFVGPGLPLDVHYAIGNFIGDALAGRTIEVQGDGRAVRSYQYIADTMVWLWTLLLAPVQGVFNVGSDQACSIAELAQQVSDLFHCPLVIRCPNSSSEPSPRYVPSVAKAQQLGLTNEVGLRESIEKTMHFYRMQFANQPMECV